MWTTMWMTLSEALTCRDAISPCVQQKVTVRTHCVHLLVGLRTVRGLARALRVLVCVVVELAVQVLVQGPQAGVPVRGSSLRGTGHRRTWASGAGISRTGTGISRTGTGTGTLTGTGSGTGTAGYRPLGSCRRLGRMRSRRLGPRCLGISRSRPLPVGAGLAEVRRDACLRPGCLLARRHTAG